MTAEKPCPEGFHWIGQAWTSCDKCGLPAWEHAGEARLAASGGPFDPDARYVLQPWGPGGAELIRAEWERLDA